MIRVVLMLVCGLVGCSSSSSPSPSPAPASATPNETAAPAPPNAEPAPSAAAAAAGELTVDVNGEWGEVWLDGVRITDETPLNAWETVVGSHEVRVVNPESGVVLLDERIEVRPDTMTIVHVEAATGRHRIEHIEI